jgi:hypothetical protein
VKRAKSFPFTLRPFEPNFRPLDSFFRVSNSSTIGAIRDSRFSALRSATTRASGAALISP